MAKKSLKDRGFSNPKPPRGWLEGTPQPSGFRLFRDLLLQSCLLAGNSPFGTFVMSSLQLCEPAPPARPPASTPQPSAGFSLFPEEGPWKLCTARCLAAFQEASQNFKVKPEKGYKVVRRNSCCRAAFSQAECLSAQFSLRAELSSVVWASSACNDNTFTHSLQQVCLGKGQNRASFVHRPPRSSPNSGWPVVGC